MTGNVLQNVAGSSFTHPCSMRSREGITRGSMIQYNHDGCSNTLSLLAQTLRYAENFIVFAMIVHIKDWSSSSMYRYCDATLHRLNDHTMSVLQAMVVPAGPARRTPAADRMDSVTWSAAAPSPNSESRFVEAARNWSASWKESEWRKLPRGMLGNVLLQRWFCVCVYLRVLWQFYERGLFDIPPCFQNEEGEVSECVECGSHWESGWGPGEPTSLTGIHSLSRKWGWFSQFIIQLILHKQYKRLVC